MSGGGAKNSSARLLPPIKNPLFNPNEDSDEVRVTSVLQNGHSDRPRQGRRLGGLANLFSSRHRNSFSPNSAGGEDREPETSGESSNAVSHSKPTARTAQVGNRKTLLADPETEEVSGSSNVKPTNSRVTNNRFSRNLSNNKTEADGEVLVEERNSPSDRENRKRISSSKQGSKITISEPKKTGLLRRDKEKRGLLVKQDSEDSGKFLSTDPQHERLHSAPSSDSEVVVHRNNRSKKEEKKKAEVVKYEDAMSLRNEWREAMASGEYRSLLGFLTSTFDTFSEMVSIFKKKDDFDPEELGESGIDHDFVRITYDIVLSLPQDIQKNVLKSVINSLLQDIKRKRTKTDLRAYTILLQNPQFNKTATYVIFAHLLRQISSLMDAEHQFLVHWFRRLPVNTFKAIITRVQQMPPIGC